MAIKPIGAGFMPEGTPTPSANNGKVLTATTADGVLRNIFVSTSDPSGGNDGDIWIKYI